MARVVSPVPIEEEYRERSRLYGTAVRSYRDPALLLLMLEDLRLAEGLSVLDLGAGQGDASLPLWRGGAQVMAVDISREMLETGGERGGLEPGKWVVCDLRKESLPFADSTFDVALTRFVIHDLSDLNLLFKEVHRVLRPQGLFQVVDMSLPTGAGISLYNAIHSRKALSGRLPCWIRDVPSLRRSLDKHHFSVVREHWYSSQVESTDWLSEGQIDDEGHRNLVAYVTGAISKRPRPAMALGLSVGDGRFSARFPVVVLTSRNGGMVSELGGD